MKASAEQIQTDEYCFLYKNLRRIEALMLKNLRYFVCDANRSRKYQIV